MPSSFPQDIENLIAQLRGLPQDYSRSRLRHSQTIDYLIDVNLKSLKLGQPRPEDHIMANWRNIVGEKNAHRSCPKIISKGTLIISVSNSTIRNELLFERSNILKRLCALPGCQHIAGISFLAG